MCGILLISNLPRSEVQDLMPEAIDTCFQDSKRHSKQRPNGYGTLRNLVLQSSSTTTMMCIRTDPWFPWEGHPPLRAHAALIDQRKGDTSSRTARQAASHVERDSQPACVPARGLHRTGRAVPAQPKFIRLTTGLMSGANDNIFTTVFHQDVDVQAQQPTKII